MIPRPSADRSKRMIEMDNVGFTYDAGVEALRSVSLMVSSGEFLAIVGGNGSGKTTLAKLMNGLLRPSGGSIKISGVPAESQSIAELSKTVGYCFQNPDHQLFCTSVEDEVMFGPKNLGIGLEESRERMERALSLMGISSLKTKSPFSLSLSERRRVTIASIVAMTPQVMILDEPTTGLDADESSELMALIRKLNADGRTIILITHEMKLVAEHADRVIILSDGHILLDSDVRGAFSDPEILKTSRLLPPPVTLLARRISSIGISRDLLTSEEFVFELSRRYESR